MKPDNRTYRFIFVISNISKTGAVTLSVKCKTKPITVKRCKALIKEERSKFKTSCYEIISKTLAGEK